MSRTITPVDIANKDDAKTIVSTFVVQDEQISKIEITITGAKYAGAVTFNDPPAPPAVGDPSLQAAETAALAALDNAATTKVTIDRADDGKFTVTVV